MTLRIESSYGRYELWGIEQLPGRFSASAPESTTRCSKVSRNETSQGKPNGNLKCEKGKTTQMYSSADEDSPSLAGRQRNADQRLDIKSDVPYSLSFVERQRIPVRNGGHIWLGNPYFCFCNIGGVSRNA